MFDADPASLQRGQVVGLQRHAVREQSDVAPVRQQRGHGGGLLMPAQQPDRAAADFIAVAVRAVHHAVAPALGQAGQFGQFVADAGCQQQLARGPGVAVFGTHHEAIHGRLGGGDRVTDPAHGGIVQQLRLGVAQQLGAGDAVLAQHAVRMRGEAVARQAAVDHQHLTAGPGQDQRGGQAGKTAADDNRIKRHGELLQRGGPGGGRIRRQVWPGWCRAGGPQAGPGPGGNCHRALR
ncbi:hypothetical protein D3C71_1230920 [compost metagenome]